MHKTQLDLVQQAQQILEEIMRLEINTTPVSDSIMAQLTLKLVRISFNNTDFEVAFPDSSKIASFPDDVSPEIVDILASVGLTAAPVIDATSGRETVSQTEFLKLVDDYLKLPKPPAVVETALKNLLQYDSTTASPATRLGLILTNRSMLVLEELRLGQANDLARFINSLELPVEVMVGDLNTYVGVKMPVAPNYFISMVGQMALDKANKPTVRIGQQVMDLLMAAVSESLSQPLIVTAIKVGAGYAFFKVPTNVDFKVRKLLDSVGIKKSSL